MANELIDRKNLTFSQTQGLVELPTPMKPKLLSPQLRNSLWNEVYESLRLGACASFVSYLIGKGRAAGFIH
jgi:hypothetical protein